MNNGLFRRQNKKPPDYHTEVEPDRIKLNRCTILMPNFRNDIVAALKTIQNSNKVMLSLGAWVKFSCRSSPRCESQCLTKLLAKEWELETFSIKNITYSFHYSSFNVKTSSNSDNATTVACMLISLSAARLNVLNSFKENGHQLVTQSSDWLETHTLTLTHNWLDVCDLNLRCVAPYTLYGEHKGRIIHATLNYEHGIHS